MVISLITIPCLKMSNNQIRRLCRRLAADGYGLRKAPQSCLHDLGEFYLVNPYYNCVAQHDVDLEELATDYGV
jgi:hypothetical protein